MHLISLNIPDLLIPLWRGTFECDADDDKSTWTWAVLTGNVWKDFGKAVTATTPHLPGFFDHPPRNPAEKINSGYKAWEFTLLLYGIGPLVLHNVLPLPYWQHFCKLVRAVRIISQHNITREELQVAARLFVEFIEEFEQLYYQRRLERIHFIRQSIHALGHYANEVATKGPLICASQWTMERTIGNLVSEICQPSNPYANLAQCAIRRAQHNALMIMIPTLDPDYNKPLYPRWSKDLGSGYVLLKLQERCLPRYILPAFSRTRLLRSTYVLLSVSLGSPSTSQWTNMSVSLFTQRNSSKCSTCSKCKVLYFAEVLFFFEIRTHPDVHALEPLALVTIYSPPDCALLQDLSDTFYTCAHRGEAGLRVVRVPSIQSVVAIGPAHA
ncbi:hypothetical protein DFH29DRAFT_817451 [Suillus ampliporus]|nr:hypothetical protein DFH29DRAFT_817451 [Suillus ampliporus]